MKPLGTITKYYPFIDEETKSILNSLMAESSSYYDFVQRLSDKVLEEEVPVNLVYLAAVHAWWCRLEEIKPLIQEKYRDVPCVRPWAYGHNSFERDQIRFHDDVVKSVENAIATSVEDWMETELHLLHTLYHWPAGETVSLLEPVEKAKKLIDANPLLNCFTPLVCAFEAIVRFREGVSKVTIEISQRGRELAESFDDSIFWYMNVLEHATFLRFSRVQESLALFEELYDVAQDLEVPYFLGEVLHDSALVFETAGEYDFAISSHHEKMIAYGMEDIPDVFPTRIYATLGDGQKALSAIDRYFEYAEPVVTSLFHIWRAWALALVDRLDEAEQTLNFVHPQVMKSGEEGRLGTYYHCCGVVELRKGNFLDAFDLLEKAWEIAERVPSGTNQNRALLDLALTEILISAQSKGSTNVVAPGKWLCKLEDYATERDLPGIRMQAAFLKSEFYQNHGQLKDALAVLEDALAITDSKGVLTLRKKIKSRIREMSQLLREAEVSSKKKR